AQNAEHNHEKVAVATRAEVEGLQMGNVAEQSSGMIESTIEAQAESRRQSGTRPTLKTREKPPANRPSDPASPRTRQDQSESHPGTTYTPPEFRRPHTANPAPATQPSPQPADTSKPPN